MLGHRLGGMRYTCCACVSAMGWDGSARASGGRGTVRGVAQLRDLNGKALELHAEVLDGLRILCAHRGISGNSMHHSRSTNDRLPGKKPSIRRPLATEVACWLLVSACVNLNAVTNHNSAWSANAARRGDTYPV
jgi:hypothetical protein